MTLPIPVDVVEHMIEAGAEAARRVIGFAAPLFGDHPKDVPSNRTHDILYGPGGTPPQGPPQPPPPPPPGGGGLTNGAQGAGDTYNKTTVANELTDGKVTDVLKQIFASNDAARTKIQAILDDIRTKSTAVGGQLGDPASVTMYQQYLSGKLADVQKILDDAQVDSQTQSQILSKLGDEYRTNGPNDPNGKGNGNGSGNGGGGSDPGNNGGGSDPGGSGGGGGSDPGGSDPGGSDPGGAGPVTDPLAGMGPLGMGGMDPLGGAMGALGPALSGLSGLGSGLGGADPLGGALGALGPALSGLGQAGAQQQPPGDGFSDKGSSGDHKDDNSFGDHGDGKGDGKTDDKNGNSNTNGNGSNGSNNSSTGPDGNGTAHTENAGNATAAPGANPGAAAPAAATNPAAGQTTVTMPDGTPVTVDAKTGKVMEAIMAGKSVPQSFHDEAGVDLAPPGTPVTDPVPPNDLAPGMVARFTSRDPVPYMGNKHVWLDGQLQPQSALNGVGGFLGWSNPMAAKAAPAAPAAPAGQQGA